MRMVRSPERSIKTFERNLLVGCDSIIDDNRSHSGDWFSVATFSWGTGYIMVIFLPI
jgi:hypothetical protein